MKALEELTQEIREKLPRLRENKEIVLDDGSFGILFIGLADLMINDVLEWHSKYYSKNSHFEVFNIKNERNPSGVFLDHSEEDTAMIIWDLSKPYLKDQSPELINFLHGLINHKKTKQ